MSAGPPSGPGGEDPRFFEEEEQRQQADGGAGQQRGTGEGVPDFARGGVIDVTALPPRRESGDGGGPTPPADGGGDGGPPAGGVGDGGAGPTGTGGPPGAPTAGPGGVGPIPGGGPPSFVRDGALDTTQLPPTQPTPAPPGPEDEPTPEPTPEPAGEPAGAFAPPQERRLPGVEGQGAETGPGASQVASQASEIERRVLQNNPNLSAEDVAVTFNRATGEFDVELTRSFFERRSAELREEAAAESTLVGPEDIDVDVTETGEGEFQIEAALTEEGRGRARAEQEAALRGLGFEGVSGELRAPEAPGAETLVEQRFQSDIERALAGLGFEGVGDDLQAPEAPGAETFAEQRVRQAREVGAVTSVGGLEDALPADPDAVGTFIGGAAEPFEGQERAGQEVAESLFEAEIERQTGADVTPGEDFEVVESGGQFEVEVTARGERRLGGDEFEDEITALPIPSFAAPGFVEEGAPEPTAMSQLFGVSVPGFTDVPIANIPGTGEGVETFEDLIGGVQGAVTEFGEEVAEATDAIPLFGRPIQPEELTSEAADEGPIERQFEAGVAGAFDLVSGAVGLPLLAEEGREVGIEAERIRREEGIGGIDFERVPGTERGIGPGPVDVEGEAPQLGFETAETGALPFIISEARELGGEVVEGLQEQASTPEGRARLGGSFVASAAIMGGAQALSPRAGAATRFAIQPGEEIVSAGLTRTFPGIARRFPNQRIDNEEIMLRMFGRAGEAAVSPIRQARQFARGEAELPPSPRQAELIERFRPGAGTAEFADPVFGSVSAEIELEQRRQAGARSEPLGAPTETILEATTGIEAEGVEPVRPSAAQPEAEAATAAERTERGELPLFGEIQEAGGVRPVARGEERIGETILPAQVEGFEAFLSEERGQATLAPLLPATGRTEGQQRGEFEEFQDFREIQEDIFEQTLAQRRQLAGEFEAAPDPFARAFERRVEVERPTFEVEQTTDAMRLSAEAQTPFTGFAADSLLGQQFGQGLDVFDIPGAEQGLGVDVEERQDLAVDVQADLATEQRVGLDLETELAAEMFFGFEGMQETETEFETEFEAETEFETEFEPFGFEVLDDDDEEFERAGPAGTLFRNPVASGSQFLFGDLADGVSDDPQPEFQDRVQDATNEMFFGDGMADGTPDGGLFTGDGFGRVGDGDEGDDAVSLFGSPF